MTYGDHQEAAAKALADLVVMQGSAVEGPAAEHLQCRRQMLMTLTERVQHLGCRYQPELFARRRVAVVHVVRHPVWELAAVLHELPRPAVPDGAPTDILPKRPNEIGSTLELWRTVARELFLATSELQRADVQPWLVSEASGWYVVADLAETLAGVVALDRSLTRAGVLEAEPSEEYLERLLVTGGVARLARMWGTNPAADEATAGLGAHVNAGGPAIHLVRSARDIVEAQHRLSGFVRPIRAHCEPGGVEDRPGLKAARVLAAGQARLAMKCAGWADATPGAEDLAAQFRNRISLFRNLHASTARLVDVQPRRPSLPLIQQSEVATQLRTLGGAAPSFSVLTELNAASHELTVNLGKALRREGMHSRTIMAMESTGPGLPVPKPITNSRHVFHRACWALSHEPLPDDAKPPVAPTHERQRLRRRLDDLAASDVPSPRRLPSRIVAPRIDRPR
jgi:hypothetical protein